MPTKPQLKAVAAIHGAHQGLVDELEAWVFSGLLSFWRRALPTDSGIYPLMQNRVRQVVGTAELPDWPASQQRWQALSAEQNPSTQCLPLLQLVDDYQLTPAQLYSLALVGLVESSHWLNLALAELQAPDKSPRPCVHLLCSILDSLFGDIHSHNPLDFSEQQLVHEQVLQILGDAPLPLRRVQIHPLLWSILVGRKGQWPECQLESVAAEEDWLLPPSALAEIPALKGLLKNARHPIQGVVVRGTPNSGRGLFAQRLAAALDLTAISVPTDIWRNQPVFALACHYARWLPVLRPNLAPADSFSCKTDCKSPLVVILGSDGAVEGNLLEVSLETPAQAERDKLWRHALPEAAIELTQQLAASALLSARSIARVAEHARQLAGRGQTSPLLTHIAEARRKLGADKLRLLAQPIARQISEDALVLPTMVTDALNAIILRACKRESLWDQLGDTLKVTPNAGVRALFVGESGTGKTLAASYIATRLGAPLYRVDLSAVMNKYIGESEKNLAQLLDQAAASDVVLLFDEADALFGSRGEGQENGERFANMLTNFLLTRIESHPGIVILTTNSRERIDTAFTRRLDSIVEFPLPGFDERLHLWRSHFGERGPGEEVYRHLASICDLAGGQVRNVVLTAAVYAEGTSISNANLLEGLRAEYRKQGRDMPRKLDGLVDANIEKN